MKNKTPTNENRIDAYETTLNHLSDMLSTFEELSRKKPDMVVSNNKVKVVNRLLEKVRVALEDESSLQFLDLIDSDDVPQVSDVKLMLSQYVVAMRSFRAKHDVSNPFDAAIG